MSEPSLESSALADLLADVLHPRHFTVQPPLTLTWEMAYPETIRWEIYRGRLLDPAHTRAERTFLSWGVFQVENGERSAEPLLSLRWDREGGAVHVVRGLLCHVWEGYDSGGGVILSRETTRWVRELVGTLHLAEQPDLAAVRQDLAGYLFHAVVGASRLPLTSLEAPHPAFALGWLGYRDGDKPPSQTELARTLELALRGGRRTDALALLARLEQGQYTLLLQAIINDTSLSPWTDFIPKLLLFCREAVARGLFAPRDHVEFLGWTLRQLGRHLTAYDLITFHHRGANYPDALLLDAFLKELLWQCAEQPAAFDNRRLRRALRQAWLLRRFYEGHRVPDAPTSPGENLRVLPPPHVRVPEEQILNSGKRRRALYQDDSLEKYLNDPARALLAQSVLDLESPGELRELGLALFIDRPFSFGKTPGEPDHTPLVSFEAFSRSIARQRLKDLPRLFPDVEAGFVTTRLEQLSNLPVRGVKVAEVVQPQPRVVSLADALRAAEDFVLLRTTRATLAPVLALLDLHLDWQPRLLAPGPANPAGRPRLVLYDAALRPRLELTLNLEKGYQLRAGVEWPVVGIVTVAGTGD